jgi:hypothetical protein
MSTTVTWTEIVDLGHAFTFVVLPPPVRGGTASLVRPITLVE